MYKIEALTFSRSCERSWGKANCGQAVSTSNVENAKWILRRARMIRPIVDAVRTAQDHEAVRSCSRTTAAWVKTKIHDVQLDHRRSQSLKHARLITKPA